MSDIVILSGSPSEYSRSEHILKYMGTLLKKRSFNVIHLSVRDAPQSDLFAGRYDSEDIQAIVDRIKRAQGVIVGSPVYKDRKSTRLNSSHVAISYAVFC